MYNIMPIEFTYSDLDVTWMIWVGAYIGNVIIIIVRFEKAI